ncbi:uncharacterized protein DNG_07881 [Cephalotrichum gorgonifer]|uniref:Uncharacterized protein n=1 Tax=Cephalotrichum gorgonifer TaxID=2041049 RepID=A0AAE8N2P9_9PEZI|nr:uncharacterized protein DNG_07881 [Cephalotrichum gorgonifer]
MPEGCDELLRKLAAAETYVSKWAAKRVKSPSETHHEKVQKLQAKIDKEMEGFTSGLDTEAMRSAANRMMKYTTELKDLEYTYASQSKERAEQYERQLEAHLEDLVPLDISSNPAKRRCTEPQEDTEEDDSGVTGEEPGLPLSTGNNTIDFKDVFQDGTAEHKHIIVQYPKDKGDWYIFRCDEHNLHFGLSPLHGAAKHIAGKKHGYPREYTGAIALCGIKVLNCNSSLAEKNNAVTRQSINNEGYMPVGAHWKKRGSARQGLALKEKIAPAQPSRPQRNSVASRRRRDFLGVTDPVVGAIYRGYWAKARNWYGVLVLPRSKFFDDPSFESLNLPEELAGTYLSDHIPDCYHSSKQSEDGVRTLIDWEDGFEDGGPFVSERQFPVLFFDGRTPSEDSVGWLTSRDLEQFDPEAAPADDIPHLALIRAYLEARVVKDSQLGREERAQAIQSPLHGTFP